MIGYLSDGEREAIQEQSVLADSRLDYVCVLIGNLYDRLGEAGDFVSPLAGAAFQSAVLRHCTAALVHELRALRLTLNGRLEEMPE